MECIRARVQAAREIYRVRFSNLYSSDIVCNADMRIREIRQFCRLPEGGQSLMRAAMSQLNLLARGYHRILKLASTVADLVESEEIQSVHLADALQYRPKLWNLSGHNTDIAAMITKIVPQHFKLIML